MRAVRVSWGANAEDSRRVSRAMTFGDRRLASRGEGIYGSGEPFHSSMKGENSGRHWLQIIPAQRHELGALSTKYPLEKRCDPH